MLTRLIVPAMLTAIVFSAPVLAAETAKTPAQPAPAKHMAMSPKDECTAYQAQFDAALPTHEKAAKLADAKKLRAEGGTLCTSGKEPNGAAKLAKALRDLGVKPKA